jgi:hypothetical protein
MNVPIPLTNHTVWRHPGPGVRWAYHPVTDAVRAWLDQHAGIAGWMDFGYVDRPHFLIDDPKVALMFKLTWGGI